MDALIALATYEPLLSSLAMLTLLLPALGSGMLVVLSISGVRPSERWIAVVSSASISLAALSAVLLAALTMLHPEHEFDEVLWTMYQVGDYHLDVSVYVDPLSAMLIALGALVIPVLGRFSGRYLHKEPGFLRFFVLVGIAATGFFWFVLGGSIDMAFFGWELLGLSSVLLVAFFWDRPETVVASARIFVTYRVADIALLMGVVLLHHDVGDSSWRTVLQVGEPGHHLGETAATILGLAFLMAAIAKSAQAPVSAWILRAMEGPTPSSALFYGTLSIHAGVYLLLRVAPVLEDAPIARIAVIVVGLVTAITSSASARVRADAKGALALAASAQAGLMFVETGLGLTTLAMWHLLAHGLLRLGQFLRAPSWLQDAQARRRALGGATYRPETHWEKVLPFRLRAWLHAAALSRFGFDGIVERLFVRPLAELAHLVSRPRPRMRRAGVKISSSIYPPGMDEMGEREVGLRTSIPSAPRSVPVNGASDDR
jgi:NADH:ubiquinone oxidoreductase subunit 5 (subunit L)/multisubunit Na+/H+ antiporter MnhA subunit